MSHTEPRTHHRFFILGLRLHVASRPGERSGWRLSLEDPRTTERIGFRSLAELNAYLETWMNDKSSEEEGDREP